MRTGIEHAMARIGFLADKDRLNALFDIFEKDGMPMGSDRWVDYVCNRYLELKEKERTMHKMVQAFRDMKLIIEMDGSGTYRLRRNKLTEEFQERKRREELQAEAEYLNRANVQSSAAPQSNHK